jgi:ABC-2 type transport system permease protein
MPRSLAIARNELRVMRRDPLPLVVLLVMPLIMAPLFAATFRAALIVSGHRHASGADFAIPGQAVQFAFFLAPFTAFLFFREHGWKTWTRLRSSPASSAEIMIGKSVPMVVLGVLQIVALLTFGHFVLGLHLHGETLALVGVEILYVVCAVAFGIALTALLRTSQQVNAFGFLCATLMAAIGGALVPLNTLPAWTRRLAPATPQYWAMRASHDLLLDGKAAGAIVAPLIALALFTAAFVAIALRRFRFDDVKIGWS